MGLGLVRVCLCLILVWACLSLGLMGACLCLGLVLLSRGRLPPRLPLHLPLAPLTLGWLGMGTVLVLTLGLVMLTLMLGLLLVLGWLLLLLRGLALDLGLGRCWGLRPTRGLMLVWGGGGVRVECLRVLGLTRGLILGHRNLVRD